MNILQRHGIAALPLAMSIALTGCVDNDYDLSKDIDMNITVGGNITIPSSSTDNYTMKQILDLDEHGNSCIQPIGDQFGLAAGDYVLVQDGNKTPSTYSISRISITDIKANGNSASLSFPVGQTSATVNNLTNVIELNDDNVDKQILSIDEARTNFELKFRLSATSTSSSYTGSAVIAKGFRIAFPKQWVMENRTTGGYTTLGNDNVLTFTQDRTIPAGGALDLVLHISAFDLTKAAAGQGLYEPGHFKFDSEIVSNGQVRISGSSNSAVNMRVTATPIIPTITVTGLTGKVDPNISMSSSYFPIEGIPGFLHDQNNVFDFYNPCIYFTINNTCPAAVSLNAVFVANYHDGKPSKTIRVGDLYGTSKVMIPAGTTSTICLSRLGQNGKTGAINVAVPQLSELFMSLPSSIEVTDIKAKIPTDKSITFELGQNYSFDVDYQLVVPLSFGENARFTYFTDDKDWDEDLEDYNFNQAIATLTIENTSPVRLVPEINALDRNGNIMTDVTATVEGFVAGGSVSAPATSELKITLKSTARNLNELNGVAFLFNATNDGSHVGVPFNVAQYIKFSDIVLKIIGGIDIDLN